MEKDKNKTGVRIIVNKSLKVEVIDIKSKR